MTDAEALELVDRLVVGWHGYAWRDATIETYATQLEPLRHDAAAKAIDQSLATLAKPPAIADLLALYRSHAQAFETLERRAQLTADERLPEDYLEAGRQGLAQARAILRNAGRPHD